MLPSHQLEYRFYHGNGLEIDLGVLRKVVIVIDRYQGHAPWCNDINQRCHPVIRGRGFTGKAGLPWKSGLSDQHQVVDQNFIKQLDNVIVFHADTAC